MSCMGSGISPIVCPALHSGPVDNRNSIGLRSLLLNVRFYGRVLSHGKRHRMARGGQGRPVLLATSPVIPHLTVGRTSAQHAAKKPMRDDPDLVMMRIGPSACECKI